MQITTNKAITEAKRFRIDAVLIFTLGLLFLAALILLLINNKVGATVFIIPALLSFSMTGYSLQILKNNRIETLIIDTQKKELTITSSEKIAFNKINKISLTGNIYKSLVLETEGRQITLFMGFIILKKFIYISKLLHQEKIALTENLVGLMNPSKNKMGLKIIISMLSIWGIITLITRLLR